MMTRQRDPHLDQWQEPRPPARACEHEGCAAFGEYRAPRSRESVGQKADYLWLCLDHVRAYNAAWDYYAGMSEAAIEADLRRDTVWQRPTWKLGWRIAGRPWRDPLNIFGRGGPGEGADPLPRQRALSDEEKALELFELEPPFDLKTLKARYRVLVKRHHPDTHGGSKEAEERLKLVTRAYTLLKPMAAG